MCYDQQTNEFIIHEWVTNLSASFITPYFSTSWPPTAAWSVCAECAAHVDRQVVCDKDGMLAYDDLGLWIDQKPELRNAIRIRAVPRDTAPYHRCLQERNVATGCFSCNRKSAAISAVACLAMHLESIRSFRPHTQWKKPASSRLSIVVAAAFVPAGYWTPAWR